ncbi:ATP-binding cassette domain-containing protein [Ancylothrix sp. C2]|uniref:phosphonate ABC transporter ATP-binding protein n=1 Tax=Ancylothrix sp. D3o TaxID=2953691 RepID=UPI0021BB039D|nr:ATP-binding cassette domain-containing protein [Ancylothrix sp. D3o]MCT7949554.1 ATP-binding cassette domain-containing protein [Ancylothrix sp. D3o]
MIIECKGIETGYNLALGRPILNGINFSVKSGEFVTLLGLNGAGKSTLLKALVGLVPIQKGEICVKEVPVKGETLKEVRRNVGFLFQGGGLVRQLSALDNVLCGRLGALSAWQTLGGFSKKDRQDALELLESLGLGNLADQKTGLLSGGQQQRVAIARALIQRPEILLADEPTTGLDVLAARQVMDIFANLCREKNITVVVVLHDLELASLYADRAVILDAGRVIYDGVCGDLSKQFADLKPVKL